MLVLKHAFHACIEARARVRENQDVNPDDQRFLRQAIDISRQARAHGNHPFGAVLVDASGTVLLEAENTVETAQDCTGHAELNAVRRASMQFGRDILSHATLYSSAEPCAMCAGAIYWSGISRLVFALSESRLRELTGDHPDNPTLSLPCREVFARGQRVIEVLGPELESEAEAMHQGFWTR